MKTVLRLFLILACLFMFGALPVLAEGQGGEGQGLNEAGDIFNAAQHFTDTAERFIIGRNVRMRDTAEVRDDNISGEFAFGEPVQIVAEVGDFYQVKVVTNEIIREMPRRFVYKEFVGSWEQVENKMKPSSSYMIELNRMADVIFAISSNLDPEGNTPVQKPKTKQEKIREIRYYQGKLPGIRTYIRESGMGYQKALKIDPNYAHAYCNLGAALLTLGQYEKAKEYYEKGLGMIVVKDANYATSLANYGYLLCLMGKKREGLKTIKKAEKYGYKNGDKLRAML